LRGVMTEAGTAGRSPSVRRVERLDALHGVPWVGSFGWRWRIQVSLGHALSLCAVVGLVVVASLVGVTALGSAVGVPPLPPPLELINQRLPGIFRLHMMTSGLALILLPWAIALRRRRRTHRAIGWMTVTLLVAGLLTSQPTALASEAVL